MLLNQDMASRQQSRLSLRMASSPDDLYRVQKLRFDIFHGEMGAQLSSMDQGIDADLYDEFCDHLIVEDQASGVVVGTWPAAIWHRQSGAYSRSCLCR